ncbi:hypothetical protein MMC06_003124 [Schaereria dolodes]|nr:hypothetical protein [Schaereria dolodes]
MFMLRYAIRFLEIPAQVQKDLQKEYFQMVWDDRSSGMINDFHACCSPMTGGMGCFDLDTIANTAAVTAVAKTFVRPNEPWVHLAKDIILRSALETQILTEAATSPWLRWWKKLNEGREFDSGIVRIKPPGSSEETLNTYIWYHPRMDGRCGAGPKKWGSEIWALLWERSVRTLGDVWDTVTEQPIVPEDLTLRQKVRVRTTI